jgi:zinc transport system substrate-binding protein
LFAGCDEAPQTNTPTAPEKPVIYTTFYPAQYFAQRIAGDKLEVVCPVPEGEDPIFWQPDDQARAAYQQADLVILNGAGFEKWAATANLPASRVLDSAKPLEAEFIRYEDAVTHSHGPGGEHAHEGIDGHTWLDPLNAKIQAEQIKLELVKRWPEHAAGFEWNFAQLADNLDNLDADLRGFAELAATAPMLASHPAYNYLARRYQWKLKSLDLDPDTMPSDEAIAKIRTLQVDFPARILLWESPPRPEIAARLAEELKLKSIVFSPCELLSAEDREASRDYLSVMRANNARLNLALREQLR